MILFNFRLLGLFSYHLRLPRPILFLWASLARFIPWGILGPSHSFLLLTFPWAFAKSFRLSWPNYHILYFWVYWPLNQPHLLIPFFGAPPAHLCLLSTSYDSHKLTTSFFEAPLGSFAFFGVLLLFCGPMNHYSCHLGLIVFLTLLILLSSPLLYCWASSCHWAFSFCQNGPQQRLVLIYENIKYILLDPKIGECILQ